MQLTTLISTPLLSLAVLAAAGPLAAQTRYTLIDLGPPNSPFSQATGINNYGLAVGLDLAADGTQHAAAWYWGTLTDISKPGLGGPNSAAGVVNNFGQITGVAETSVKDPNNENFCAFGTGNQCLAFLWDFGTMIPLPSLGGTNSNFGSINDLGEVAGFAENSHLDPDCPAAPAANGTGPQVLDFEAVVWGPSPGEIRELPPIAGDTVSMALGINSAGVVVGASGTCANTVIPGLPTAPHAVIWEKDGTVHSLPNLGGNAPDKTAVGVGNIAWAINRRGIIAGQAALPNNTVWHPVLWQDGIVSDLGVLPGDAVGSALDLNNRGEVVGASVTAPGPSSGNPRAFVWRDGVMEDLNTLVSADSPLYLLTAFSINDRGEIVGFGAAEDGDLHGFLAVPCEEDSSGCGSGSTSSGKRGSRSHAGLSERARKELLRSGFRRP